MSGESNIKYTNNPDRLISDAEKLYFNEKYLRVVKLANEKADSKYIVDRATKLPVSQVLSFLEELDETNIEQINVFIENCLHEPGVEITKANFVDWNENPKFVDALRSDELRTFSLEVNKIWLDLYKKFDVEKLSAECVSSHLPMKHPFVVPGGRFIEMYYWDTYWTIEGLLVCDMFDTVQQILENFIQFIDHYGFIPNGSRVYYLNRSQPPYFSLMVTRFFEASMSSKHLSSERKQRIKNFVLNEALFFMIKEYKYWMKNKLVEIKVGSAIHRLNIFKAFTTQPRPESYFEDLHTAMHLDCHMQKGKLFMDIATAAESGYDFSSRWFEDPHSMHTIITSDIVPVDLNAVMFKNEVNIARLCLIKGNLRLANLFRNYASRRRFAMNELLWSAEKLCWTDLNWRTGKQIGAHFYVSNLAPLSFGMRPPGTITVKQVIEAHAEMLSRHDGGVPVSSIRTEQQWDQSNVWAPNQHALIMMLLKQDRKLALSVAKRFFNTVYSGWRKTGMIYEKYNLDDPGTRGSGGEYEVQAGFGWTNGVILNIINIFKDDLVA